LITNQCIYKKGNIEDLINLLSRVDEEFLNTNAKLNFEKAKDYQKINLEKKRNDFYSKFLQDSELI